MSIFNGIFGNNIVTYLFGPTQINQGDIVKRAEINTYLIPDQNNSNFFSDIVVDVNYSSSNSFEDYMRKVDSVLKTVRGTNSTLDPKTEKHTNIYQTRVPP